MEASEGDLLSRGYGAVLWEPDDKTVREARVTRFMSWLEARHHLHPGGYDDLWQWSVSEPGGVLVGDLGLLRRARRPGPRVGPGR